ncbi:hypothetical protein Q9L58_001098 [Maublancomyces gigas]|uniref:Uncharacterized protein n=1 Tax=Discina gigas TaxID=1032678 RepID=A0ABR3GVA3_9PEZI
MEEEHPFPYHGYEWYILEKWDPLSNLSNEDQYTMLSLEYLELGNWGRRAYQFCALDARADDSTVVPPVVPDNVPRSLRTTQERGLDPGNGLVWLRTHYLPGEDERHEEFIEVSDGTWKEIFDDLSLYDDPQITNDMRRFLARVPQFLDLLREDPDSTEDWQTPEVDVSMQNLFEIFVADVKTFESRELAVVTVNDKAETLIVRRVPLESVIEAQGFIFYGSWNDDLQEDINEQRMAYGH